MRDSTMDNFADVVHLIANKSPLQKKRLEKYLAESSPEFIDEANRFVRRYSDYLAQQHIAMEEAVDAYLELCADMMRCQISFAKTGIYPHTNSDEVHAAVYANQTKMTAYMTGLALSQFLWPTHYAMYRFLCDAIVARKGEIGRYLEVGPGHGMFLDYALSVLPGSASLTAVDISATSINVSKSIITHFHPNRRNIDFVLGDMLEVETTGGFDFIAMGEVLEHVQTPQNLLVKLGQLLAPNGSAFISTCANCPAIDHVYQFNNVREIRALIAVSGLRVIDEKVLPVENLPMDEIEARKITVNYCALVERYEEN